MEPRRVAFAPRIIGRSGCLYNRRYTLSEISNDVRRIAQSAQAYELIPAVPGVRWFSLKDLTGGCGLHVGFSRAARLLPHLRGLRSAHSGGGGATLPVGVRWLPQWGKHSWVSSRGGPGRKISPSDPGCRPHIIIEVTLSASWRIRGAEALNICPNV